MARKDMKGALGASMKAEEEAVTDRFARADAHLGTSTPPPNAPLEEPSKVIRDSFTMPSSDYALIADIKERCLKAGTNVTKSEVLRAGLTALIKLDEPDLLQVIQSLSKVKTGRPPQIV